ncbi:MAG: AAA family ATPase [Planctomycetes bacterium]|nr:AAA family ATPase [Planctomycetota bacterium]
MTNLFTNEEEFEDLKYKPLADRMRPQTIDDFVGQEHLLGKNKLLNEIISREKLVSLILWGPPGCGKTTLARLIYKNANVNFEKFSAVLSGVAEVRKITAEAQKILNFNGKRTVLFVDEIHRFNKMQQDAFLPVVENGTIILIGATTENPSFEVISPLLSRCRVLRLQPLTEDNIKTIVEQVLNNEELGFGGYNLEIDDKAF